MHPKAMGSIAERMAITPFGEERQIDTHVNEDQIEEAIDFMRDKMCEMRSLDTPYSTMREAFTYLDDEMLKLEAAVRNSNLDHTHRMELVNSILFNIAAMCILASQECYK